MNANLQSKGVTPQETMIFQNSGSKGGIGQDLDLGLKEPPRFVMSAGKQIPNPEYAKWRNGMTMTGADGTVRKLTPAQYAQKAQLAMEEAFVEQYGRPPQQAFLNFTYSGHPEAYANKAWIGRAGLKTADFSSLEAGGEAWRRQAGDVTGFKVNELPKSHPSLGTYTTMQEQCRGMAKDITTKLAGAPRGAPINPQSPLAKAPKHVQEHFIKLREVMDDFGTNRIGPIHAERRIADLTGGLGIAEAAEQFGIAITR
jgi:hypothetical protein